MKIGGPNGIGSAAPAPGGKRPAGGGFSVSGPGAAEAPAALAHLQAGAAVGSLAALLALQEADDPTTRQRRAVRRAGRILDVLESVRLALLDGETAASGDMARLAEAVREERQACDDPRLQALLDQIEARAAVELAKMDVRRRAA